VKSLEIQNIQLKKWMEDMARKTAKGTLTELESVAETRKEVRVLKLAMQNLEMQNIQQKKSMEGMVRKMGLEMKRLEIQMLQAKATRACEKAQFGSLQKSFPIPPVMPASSSAITVTYVSPDEESKKV